MKENNGDCSEQCHLSLYGHVTYVYWSVLPVWTGVTCVDWCYLCVLVSVTCMDWCYLCGLVLPVWTGVTYEDWCYLCGLRSVTCMVISVTRVHHVVLPVWGCPSTGSCPAGETSASGLAPDTSDRAARGGRRGRAWRASGSDSTCPSRRCTYRGVPSQTRCRSPGPPAQTAAAVSQQASRLTAAAFMSQFTRLISMKSHEHRSTGHTIY